MEEGPDGEDQPTVTWHRYPNAIVGHRELEYLHVAPRVIQQIYRQSVTAYAGEAYILAGIGLRATIEAVCNHLEISGNSLERRIDQLFKGGYISNSDKGRLHAIRFLGNDAAHEIKQPKRSDLRVALEIVEHLINSVFILEHRANGLDVLVDTYEKFVALLKKCASEFDSDKPATLAALLGRHKRRAGNELASFEKRVSEEIESGALTFLAVDSTQQLDDKAVQLYKVDKEKLKGESDNEIPF
ncbi:MAG TPA: DUF4145 domain-containing protein [Pirellulales bacterium]|nr:DUF4145 domain-containing protein [Pirellulales bacterium]